MQEEQGEAGGAAGAPADIGESLRPASMADMRKFLALSILGFKGSELRVSLYAPNRHS